jgi:DMSO/TMAO reductase YedYZ heme-binding membrane subunit
MEGMNRPARGRREAGSPRLEGAVLVAYAALGAGALFAGTLALHGGGEEGLGVLARATARLSLSIFAIVYAASSLRRLWRTPLTGWLLRNRRYLGLSFAVAHAFHAAAVVSLAAALGPAFEYDLVSLVFGGAAYGFVAALAATSSERAVRALGAARWRRLHRVGVHTIWLVFAATVVPTALGSPLHFALAALVLGAAGLRAAAAFAQRRAPNARSAVGA